VKSKISILVLVILVTILIFGLIAPNGIRAAVNNNIWSLAFVRNVANKTTPFVDINFPPATHAHAGLLLAHQALKQDNIDLAVAYLKPVLNPKDRLALQTFAQILFLQKEYTDAILIWKYLGQWYTLEQASRVLTQEGDIDSLILARQSAYELFPERYVIHLTRSMQSKANLYIEETQYDQAIEVYLDMLSLFPEKSSIYIDLAWVYFLNDQLDMTHQTIDQGAVLESGNSTFFLAVAQRYEKMSLPEKSLEAYKQALEIDPFSTDAQKGIESLSDSNE